MHPKLLLRRDTKSYQSIVKSIFVGFPGSPSLVRPASGASSYFGPRSIDGLSKSQSPKMKLK